MKYLRRNGKREPEARVPDNALAVASWLPPWIAENATYAGNNVSREHAERMVAQLLDGTLPYPDINIEEGTRINVNGYWFSVSARTTIENRNGAAFLCYPVNLTPLFTVRRYDPATVKIKYAPGHSFKEFTIHEEAEAASESAADAERAGIQKRKKGGN